MLFWLSKTLHYLFLPASVISIFLLLFLFTKKTKRKKRFLSVAIALFLFFSNPLIAHLAFGILEGKPQPYPEKHYSTAVVLTGVLMLNKSPHDRIYFGSGGDRFYHSLELYKKGIVDQILITGGEGIIFGDYESEALLMKKAFLYAGVKEEDLIIEPNSRNTYENAIYTEKLIQDKKLEGPFILVTSAFHMPRANGCFKKQGVKTYNFPVHFLNSDLKFTPDQILIPSAEALGKWKILIHEVIGLTAYKLLGRI